MKKLVISFLCALTLVSLPFGSLSAHDKKLEMECGRQPDNIKSVVRLPVTGAIDGATLKLTFQEDLSYAVIDIKDASGVVVDSYTLDDVQNGQFFSTTLQGCPLGDYLLEIHTEMGLIHADFSIE